MLNKVRCKYGHNGTCASIVLDCLDARIARVWFGPGRAMGFGRSRGLHLLALLNPGSSCAATCAPVVPSLQPVQPAVSTNLRRKLPFSDGLARMVEPK